MRFFFQLFSALDMRTIQEQAPCWTIVLRNRRPLPNAVVRISTPVGDSGVQVMLASSKSGK